MATIRAEFAVPHRVYFDAKHYVEEKRVHFFDFFRNSAFGFVQTSERGGYFAHLLVRESGSLEGHCRCNEAEEGEVCGHAFALYLKLLNWPFEKINHAMAFEKDLLIGFLRDQGKGLLGKRIDATTNPRLTVPLEVLDGRMSRYLGFDRNSDFAKQTMRDLECLEKAQRMTRASQEMDMMKRGLPSARLAFEESRLYSVAKLLYFLEQSAGLRVRVELLAGHQVRLLTSYEGHPVLSWDMPLAQWIKGVGANWDYWSPLAEFRVLRQALPLVYRITFVEGNALEVEPMVEVAAANYVRLSELEVPGNPHLLFHPLTGYFRIQTGLSPFEMEFSTAKIHNIEAADVKSFLRDHRETIQGLDRALIDEALFGEVVIEHFQQIELTLEDYLDNRFRFRMRAKLGHQSFEHEELSALFASKGRYRKMAGKLFDASGYDAVYLRPLYEQAADGDPSLSVAELIRVITFFRDRVQILTKPQTKAIFEALRAQTAPNPPSLEHTRLSLRPYQVSGFNWLYFLKHYGLGGLLCDQMGLGKTHQGMALLAAVLADHPEGRVLVVAPASVIYHWRDKLRTFCPGLRVAVHHGPDRNPVAALESSQILISTFATLRNDIEAFEAVSFELIIFDEIQYLKNKATKAYRSLAKLLGHCRIGLTGTPIENRIEELKALLDLVLPNFLGTDSSFKRYFSDPIALNNDHVKEQLRHMVHPFTLRRNKSEVLLDLPEKTEDIRTVEPSQYEQELYREVRYRGQAELEGVAGSGVLTMFTLIDKLKQLCDHPALYFGNEDYEAYPCVKWEMFTELLDEVMDSGEKLVIFTQYLGMVAMFKKYLTQRDLPYACITGATSNRDEEQRRFQEDPACRVFIGTVRAAGVGIDLTAASVLIHYDRWWNAAREEQATDRIHRIGQKRAVQIYKFRTVDTVEERIDKLIERKRALLDEVVGFDAENFSKVFTVDELMDILG